MSCCGLLYSEVFTWLYIKVEVLSCNQIDDA
jgi:hypothetical protein